MCVCHARPARWTSRIRGATGPGIPVRGTARCARIASTPGIAAWITGRWPAGARSRRAIGARVSGDWAVGARSAAGRRSRGAIPRGRSRGAIPCGWARRAISTRGWTVGAVSPGSRTVGACSGSRPRRRVRARGRSGLRGRVFGWRRVLLLRGARNRGDGERTKSHRQNTAEFKNQGRLGGHVSSPSELRGQHRIRRNGPFARCDSSRSGSVTCRTGHRA